MIQLRMTRVRYSILTLIVAIVVLLAIAVIIGGVVKNAYAYSGIGDGSSENPYQVSNCVQLQEMQQDRDASYVLQTDIDCSATSDWNEGSGFIPIGDGSTQFTGSLDGKNHTISDLSINQPWADNVGLFGQISATSGFVKNIYLENATIIGQNYVGAIAGNSYGTSYTNVRTDDNTTVAGMFYVGGLLGTSARSSVVDSANRGNVTGEAAFTGGIAGSMYQAYVGTSFSSGSIIGTNSTGGIVGSFDGNGISNVYVTGSIESTGTAGGLIGYASSENNFDLINSYSSATVTAGSEVGGLIGTLDLSGTMGSSVTIQNNFVTGAVEGSSFVGGLVGNVLEPDSENGATIINNFYDITATGQSECGPDIYVICDGVSDLGYFEDNTNPPLSSWNYSTIWLVPDGALPLLRVTIAPEPIDVTPPSAPGTPTATSPLTTDSTPIISWTASNDNGSGLKNPAYTLEWSTSQVFTSISGSITTDGLSGAPSSDLPDGTWYFRVKATDNADNISISGISDAVVIDTIAPTTPGTPTSVALWTHDNTPTYQWDASTDSGSGLASIAYTVEWSQDTEFSGLGGIAGSSENEYTIPDNLHMTDGIWYFRVLATDLAGHDSAWSDYVTVHVDMVAPNIDAVTAVDGMSSGEVVITWTSNEDASTKVSYGPTSSLGSSTIEADTSPRVQNHSVILNSLVPCSVYRYAVASKDVAGNLVTSTVRSFITSGCAGAANVVAHAETPITTSTGGTISLDTIYISVPSGFAVSNADFQVKNIDHNLALDAIGKPTGVMLAGSKVYDIKALQNDTTVIGYFDKPITITLSYTDPEVDALLKSSLAIYRWDTDTGWTKLDNCSVDTTERIVTCTTTHFSTFALYGQIKPDVVVDDEDDSIDHHSTPQPTQKPDDAPDLTVVDKPDTPAQNNDKDHEESSSPPEQPLKPITDTDKKSIAVSGFDWRWLLVPVVVIIILLIVALRRRNK